MGLHDLSRRFFKTQGVWRYKGGAKNNKNAPRRVSPAINLLASAVMAYGLVIGAVGTAQAAPDSARPDGVNDNAQSVVIASADASKTRYSRLVTRINRDFGHLPGHLPIVMLDRDEINNRMAILGKAADDKDALIGVIRDYVMETSGIDLAHTNADDIARFYPMKSGFAFQFTHSESPERVAEGADVCVVMARDPDRSRESTLMHKLQFSPEVYGEELYKAGIRPVMSRDEILTITDYHEMSHCLDTRHIVTVQKYLNNPGDRDLAHVMHKAEAYAEINALILMVRDGFDMSLPDRRADMRATYSFMAGPYIARILGVPRGSAINPGDYGAIYGFSPALRETGKILREMGRDKLKQMSVEEIIELSYSIVEEHALSEEEFSAITTFHGSLLHRKVAEEFAQDPNATPRQKAYWAERTRMIDAYEKRSLEAIARVIDTSKLDKPLKDLIPQYAVSEKPAPGAPQPWDAPFAEERHVLQEISEAYYDLKISMIRKGHDQQGLFESVRQMRDVLRSATSITGGELDKALRRRLAVIHAAAATISNELQSGSYKPAPRRNPDLLIQKQARNNTPKGPRAA